MVRRLMLFSFLASAFAASLLCTARAAAPAPAPDCITLVITELSPCLGYAADGSNVTKPPKECCTGVTAFIKEAPSCICTFLGNSSLITDAGVNKTRALMLPNLCNVQFNLNDNCKTASSPPTGAPTTSPTVPSGGKSGNAAAPPPVGEASKFKVSTFALFSGLGTIVFAMM